MTLKLVTCEKCGSHNLRRSHRKSLSDFAKMAAGLYPVRCLDCNHRSWVNVWSLADKEYARCPFCLRSELTVWPKKSQHMRLWRNLLVSLGANKYRCSACRHVFLSFRPRYNDAEPPQAFPAQNR